MAIEPELQPVAELAFEVARTGIESTPSIAAPAAMRSFLYVANLPSRALSVAQQVIDTDDDFRARVAAVATEERVGRVGWLYVARPAGWSDDIDGLLSGRTPSAIPTPPRPTGAAAGSPTAPPPPPPAAPSSAAIEAELTELKDLVERLTVEREQVSASVTGMEAEYDARAARGDVVSDRLADLEAELASVRTERDQAVSRLVRAETEAVALKASESPAMNERDAAREALDVANQRLHETTTERDALRRELDVVRDDLTGLEAKLEAAREERDEARAALVEARSARDDALVRMSEAEQARDDARADLERLGAEWEGVQTQVAALRDERVAISAELDRVAQIEEKQRELVAGLGRRLGEVTDERDRLVQKLRVAEARLGGTREAFAEATTRLAADLGAAEAAVVESNDEAQALSDAIDRTTRGHDSLVATYAEVDTAEPDVAPAVAAAVAPVMAPVDEPGTATVEVDPSAYFADDAADTDDVAELDTDAADDAILADATSEMVEVEPVDEKAALTEFLSPNEPQLEDLLDEEEEAPVADAGADEPMAVEDVADADMSDEVDPFAAALDEQDAADALAEQIDDDETVDVGGALASFETESDLVDPAEALSSVEAGDTVDIAEAIETPPFAGFGSGTASVGFAGADDDVDVAGALDDALPSGFGIDKAPSFEAPSFETPSILGDASPSIPDAFTPNDAPSVPSFDAPGFDVPAGLTGAAAAGVGGAAIGAAGAMDDVPARAARHQVVLPDDASNDPFRRTTSLVSAENAILLVDGDAVAALGWPTMTVAERRDALVDYLGDLVTDHATAIDVVFDGAVGDESSLPMDDRMRIRLTAESARPAVALSELVDAYPAQWPVTVATDNANLEVVAREKGAAVVTNGDLLDLFVA